MVALAICCQVPQVFAQGKPKPRPGTTSPAPAAPRPAVAVQPDTAAGRPADSLTVSAAPKGDIETTIKYTARDSIRFDVASKIVHLFGDARINYGTMSLKAAYIQINWETNILSANGIPDSTGKDIGTPVFEDGPEKYTASRIAYNFKTRRGKISGAVTQQGEGFIHAETVKKTPDNIIYGKNARYTTCNLEHPHFYINAGKMKVIPNDRVISGPFNLVVADIPTPLGFVLGLFPSPEKRASGIIIPSYGETRERGFFLRDGGYYLALNDYVGIKLLGGIYSLGGYTAATEVNYVKRYSYNGNFNFRYDRAPLPEDDLSDLTTSPSRIPRQEKSFWVNWSHTPVAKPGRGQFRASVDAGSRSNPRLVSQNTQRLLSNNFTSNISYSKVVPNSPFTYTLSLRQTQNSSPTDSIANVNFTLPDISVTMAPRNVARVFTKIPTGAWYDNITIGYNFNFRNQLTNRIEPRTFSSIPNLVGGSSEGRLLRFNRNNLGDILENGQMVATHQVPINISSFKLFKYFTLSPDITYGENWYFKKLNFSYDPVAEAVRVDTLHKFNRTYNYSGGASLTTRIYGTRVIKGKKLEALRHTIIPTVRYSYSPDLRDVFLQNLQINPAVDFLQVSPYSRFLNEPSFQGLQSRVSFDLSNNLEMKVRSTPDSAAGGFRKVSLIDRLSLSSSYNLAADSFHMTDIVVGFNTHLFQIVNTQLSAFFDPYQLDSSGRKINKYQINKSGGGFARLTNASFAIGADLNPANWGKARKQPPPSNLPTLEQGLYLSEYVDFKIPWTLNLNFTSQYNKPALLPATIAHSLVFSGTVNLTDKWKFGYTSGYDFTNKDITLTNISVSRDLHCWQMQINWIPFGFYQSYSVTINAKASILQDLRINRNRTWENR